MNKTSIFQAHGRCPSFGELSLQGSSKCTGYRISGSVLGLTMFLMKKTMWAVVSFYIAKAQLSLCQDPFIEIELDADI